MARCSIREEGLRAAALPGRVAAAYSMTLDAGPRAHERVGHIYQSVFGFALREQIFLRWKGEPSHGGVARVPQAREVLEVRAARLASTDENVVVQALEPASPEKPVPAPDKTGFSCIFFFSLVSTPTFQVGRTFLHKPHYGS